MPSQDQCPERQRSALEAGEAEPVVSPFANAGSLSCKLMLVAEVGSLVTGIELPSGSSEDGEFGLVEMQKPGRGLRSLAGPKHDEGVLGLRRKTAGSEVNPP